ncbi:MAG: HAMP domain-containing sensor histidine kinase [Acidobacteriota bacterium]
MPTPDRRRWTASLYWKIAAGFVTLVAVTLAAQVALFLWLAVRTEGGLPREMFGDLAELLAADIATAVAREPARPIADVARQRLREFHRPAAVVLPDGTVIGGGRGRGPLPPGVVRFALRRMAGDEGAGEEPLPAFAPRGPAAFAPVVVNRRIVAGVVVLPERGPRTVFFDFGPFLTLGLGVLLLASAVAALVVFRPMHRRLQALEDAARRLGAGDLAARAPEDGRDEVADVARAFNRMAAELGARQAELADADRVRRQLLADVSHELMTPLTAIRGYAETLALPRFAPASDEGRRQVAIIGEEVERIERLVGDLLDLARYEAGGLQLAPATVSVAELFARVERRHGAAAAERRITLASEVAPGAETIEVDPMRFEQALQNLVANALRHTPPRGRITLAARRDDGDVIIDVRDTGSGIPAEHLPHVFDRFYKVDPARAHAGTGLGLSIVKAIVERHGGTIRVESRVGEGTTFTIRLPKPDA